MPITPTNLPKNTITPTSTNKGGYALWDDNEVSWDSSILFWDSPYSPITNLTKTAITPTNLPKN